MKKKPKSSLLDPKLEKAYEEIESILVKHDVGGFVSLASRTHARFGIVFPKWSIAHWITRPISDKEPMPAAAIHLKNTHLKSLSEQIQATEQTFHLLFTMRDTCTMMARQMQNIYDMMQAQGFGIDHKNQMPDVTPRGN